MNVLGSILLLHALAATPGVEVSPFEAEERSASGRVLSSVGLFPMWENTGVVLGHGRFYAGSNLLGVGIADRLQLGTHPLRDAMRTPNLHAKVLLVDAPRLRIAAQAELTWVPPEASKTFTRSNFATRLDSDDHAWWIAPLAVSATWAPTRELFVHLTGTAQGVASGALPRPQATLGASAQLEWRAFRHHAFSLHATEVGFHRHDFWQAGGSYRYQRWIFEGAVGVAVRRYRQGSLVFPVAALGVEV